MEFACPRHDIPGTPTWATEPAMLARSVHQSPRLRSGECLLAARVDSTERRQKKQQGVSTSQRERELERHVVARHHSFSLSPVESLPSPGNARGDWHHNLPVFAFRLCRLMCGSASRFRCASFRSGLHPDKRAKPNQGSRLTEGPRPSAHQTHSRRVVRWFIASRKTRSPLDHSRELRGTNGVLLFVTEETSCSRPKPSLDPA